jgi:hypothetical protein
VLPREIAVGKVREFRPKSPRDLEPQAGVGY